MKNQRANFALFRKLTGKTTTTVPSVPGDNPKDQAKRLGYWPDRSAHYSGW